MRAKRHRLGLLGKLVLAILAAGTVPIVVALTVTYVEGSRELEEVIGASFQALAADSAGKVDAEIRRVIQTDSDRARQAALDPKLRDLLRSNAGVRIDWPETNGAVTDNWSLSASWLSSGGDAPRRENVGTTVTGLEVGSELNRYLFTVSTPILDPVDEAVIGWLHRDYDVKALFDPLVYPIRFGTTGHVMLIDNLGAIVSCPLLVTGSRILDNALLDEVATDTAGWITAENDGHGAQNFAIIGHSPLPEINRYLEPGISWHMFVWQDAAEIFAPARSLLTGIALAGILSIALLGILGWYASRRIVNPIRRLSEEASHIAEGDLNRNLDLQTGDEIEELANRFNDMRLQLGQFIGTLEERVEERTRDLADAQAEKDRVMQQLIQTEKVAAIGTMASGIGHEINNPLYAILGMAEAVRDEKDIERCNGYGAQIIKYSKHIAEIVKHLSGYVRPDLEPDLEPVNVNEALAEALVMARRSLLNDQIEIRENLGSVARFPAKPEEIQQALFNVIRNAMQAMDGKGTLTIESGQDEHAVWVHVRDSGIGIPEEHLSKILDPFFTTKGPDEGEGLGLYIVKQIVEKYGGTLVFESEEGQGTTCTFTFPFAGDAERTNSDAT